MGKTIYKVRIRKTDKSFSSSMVSDLCEYEILLINMIEDLVCNMNMLREHDLAYVGEELEEYLKDYFDGTDEQKEKIMEIFRIIRPNLLKEKEEAIEVVDNVDRER